MKSSESAPQFTPEYSYETPKQSLKTALSPKLGFSIVFLFLIAGLMFYFVYTSKQDAVADFFIEWKGAQIALDGGNPYSDDTTRQIQLGSKGHLVGPGEDQLAFVYPYWRIFINIPIARLPYEWASAIWLGFILSLYIAALHLTTRAIGWKPATPLVSVGFFLSLLFYFPAFSSLMLGQAALLVAALLGGVYYFLKAEMQIGAGVLLAIATVKPQLTLVLVPLLLLRALYRREWRFIASFIITMVILAGTSFIAFPAWLSEFVAVASRYPNYKPSLTGPGFIWDWVGGWLETGIVWLSWAAIAGVGLWQWWKCTRNEPAGNKPGLNFDLAYSIALILTLLLPPQTNISNPVLLFVPLTLILSRLKGLAYGGLALGIVIFSWLLYFSLYNAAYGALIVVPPLVVSVMLYVIFFRQNKAVISEVK